MFEKNTIMLHEFLQLQNGLWMEQVYLIFKYTNKKRTFRQSLNIRINAENWVLVESILVMQYALHFIL